MTPMTSLAVVVAAALLLAGAVGLIIGLCRAAADVRDVEPDDGSYR
jgi:hypothetical protein